MRSRKGRRWLFSFLTLLLTVPLLTGCWDRLEIEERAVILGIGIDLAKPGAEKNEGSISHVKGSFPTPKGEMIMLSAQVAIPGRIPLGPGEGGGGSGGGQKPVWVISVVGHTVQDAINNLQQELADRLFLGHLRIVVVSEDFAKAGMTGLSDYMRRTPEIRRTTWVVVCEDQALDLMNIAPQLERVPSLYLLATMDHAVRMGKLPNAFVGTFWIADSALGVEPFLPYVRLVDSGNMQIAGLAMFRGEKMVGHTEPLEIGVYMAMKGLNPGGYSALTNLQDKDSAITYQVTHRKARTDVAIKNGMPEFVVKISLEGNLTEKINEHFLLSNDELRAIENQLVENGLKAFNNLIKKTQEKDSDIFGFGEYVRAKEPKYWKTHIGSKENWRKMYKDVKVNVQTDFNIRRVGGKTT
ncbi:Ger(x)C family spore germination protein [Paenibacillus koleovorans]|uniref:Ger(x)C family spore germination protein n=1 Tax=Paenibacillus koleovorans TaxID=121608 RepID=UPI000FDAA256|nr:Ger(x)C family spore germination protein [Paenibacillus koleovorans]